MTRKQTIIGCSVRHRRRRRRHNGSIYYTNYPLQSYTALIFIDEFDASVCIAMTDWTRFHVITCYRPFTITSMYNLPP
jgi:hypothetical protein